MCCDMTDIPLKAAKNTIQSINQSSLNDIQAVAYVLFLATVLMKVLVLDDM